MKTKSTLIKNIFAHNKAGRIPEMVQLKYKAMRENAWRFYRGTCHLFYDDLPKKEGGFKKAPLTWLCGDLHLENFGSYKADNRLVYFDLNDFDEAVLGPCTWDISRILTSIFLAGEEMKLKKEEMKEAAQHFLNIYSETLFRGHSSRLESATTHGLIKDFFDELQHRKRKIFIEQRTVRKKNKISLRIDGKRYAYLDDTTKKELKHCIEKWSLTQSDPNFFKVLDCAIRISGTGSLGVPRFCILVNGKGNSENFLLDMKFALPSSLHPHLKKLQPVWKDEAERIISVQNRMQDASPALLSKIQFNSFDYVLKELQPTADKFSFDLFKKDGKNFLKLVGELAKILAWAQIRSTGRQGSCITDELIAFSQKNKWKKEILNYSFSYSEKVKKDYKEFCKYFS